VFIGRDVFREAGAGVGDRVEFLRRRDGTIGWIRVDDRMAPRVDSGPVK
jgi:hypothetical protein